MTPTKEEYEALLELLGEDIAFISGQSDREPCLNMNDIFVRAADAEPFTIQEAPMLLKIYETEGFDGLIQWVSKKRNEQPLKIR